MIDVSKPVPADDLAASRQAARDKLALLSGDTAVPAEIRAYLEALETLLSTD